MCLTEIHKNVISPLEGDTKEHVLHKKHTDLKQKMRDLNQGFERLRKISHEGFSEDSGELEGNKQTHTHTHQHVCAQPARCGVSISFSIYLICVITGICNHNNSLCHITVGERWYASGLTRVFCASPFQLKIERGSWWKWLFNEAAAPSPSAVNGAIKVPLS